MSDPVADVGSPLGALGWDESWAAALEEACGGVARGEPGRVLRTHRVGFDVRTPDGVVFAVTRQRHRDPLAAPATGDWVHLVEVADVEEPVISEVLPRRTALVRRDPADRAAPQVLAANADVIGVVHGADRPVNARRVERQLAMAHGSGADVVVIVSKADLDPGGAVAREVVAAAVGQTVLVTAAASDVGIEPVAALAEGSRTLVLVGESGAGKSSLVNAVIGHEALAVGGVREGDAKGRHTTTRRTLLPLPTGGALLDTPGVRAVGLWPGWADVDAVFVEIAEAASGCRFADCSHDAEPGCAVQAAAVAGEIDAGRLEAWHQLSGELKATSTELERKDWR